MRPGEGSQREYLVIINGETIPARAKSLRAAFVGALETFMIRHPDIEEVIIRLKHQKEGNT